MEGDGRYNFRYYLSGQPVSGQRFELGTSQIQSIVRIDKQDYKNLKRYLKYGLSRRLCKQ